MKILSVFDKAFGKYGRVIEGYDVERLIGVLENETPLPSNSVDYTASCQSLERLPIAAELARGAYGGMPVQLGYCNGYNTRLDCLEYHRDSEITVGSRDFILLLAKREECDDKHMLDTALVSAFVCPRGVLVELYATTLHYTPCSAKKDLGFKNLILLPRGTNEAMEKPICRDSEDECLWGKNKWLLAHKDSPEAKNGAAVRLIGENIDIADMI